MKRTLAFLIAVLMVAAMIPAAVLSAAGQAAEELWEQLPPVGYNDEPAGSEPPVVPAPAEDDVVELLDNGGASVGYYETLAEADEALQNGYTLKLLKSVEGDYTFGASRATAGSEIAFTVDGNNVAVMGKWTFNTADSVTLENCKFACTAGSAILVDGTADLTLKSGVIESAAAPGFAATQALVQVQGNATFKMTGGEICHRAGGLTAIYVKGSAKAELSGGYVESNALYTLLSGEATADVDYGLFVSGGEFVLQARHEYLAANANSAVVSCADGKVSLNGGIFINNSDSANASTKVVGKSNATGTLLVLGGVFMATPTQTHFFTTVGNSGSGTTLPVSDIPISGATAPAMYYKGRTYYVFAYKAAYLPAPEVNATVNIRLYKDSQGVSSNGLLFTSTLTPAQYQALLLDAQRIAQDEGMPIDSVRLSYGTLVMPLTNLMPESDLIPSGRFDTALYDELGLPYVMIPATPAAEGGGLVKNSASEGVEFHAALINIAEKHYATYYAGIPYVTINLVSSGEVVQKTVTYFPSFDASKGVASLSSVANRAINDNSAVKAAPYLYKSLTVPGSYSPYSAAQQTTLKSYLAHVHTYDYKGVCSGTVCEHYNASAALAVDSQQNLYCEFGDMKYYTLTLEQGVSYSIQIANSKLATYTLYDADGKICAVSGGKFTATEGGEYYLVVASLGFGSTFISLNHVHDATYLGYCSVCQTNLSVNVTVENAYERRSTRKQSR